MKKSGREENLLHQPINIGKLMEHGTLQTRKRKKAGGVGGQNASRVQLRRALRAEYIKSCKAGHPKDRWPAEEAAKIANVDISVVRSNSQIASALERGDLRYHKKLDLVFYEER